MIGYHYTSWSNWLNIQYRGLVPYKIKNEELEDYFEDGIEGIWVWKHKLSKMAHVGSVLWQFATKADTKIVQLEVAYRPKDRLCWYKNPVTLSHTGYFGKYQYHSGKEKAYILFERVSPKNIKLIDIYDLKKLI